MPYRKLTTELTSSQYVTLVHVRPRVWSQCVFALRCIEGIYYDVSHACVELVIRLYYAFHSFVYNSFRWNGGSRSSLYEEAIAWRPRPEGSSRSWPTPALPRCTSVSSANTAGHCRDVKTMKHLTRELRLVQSNASSRLGGFRRSPHVPWKLEEERPTR